MPITKIRTILASYLIVLIALAGCKFTSDKPEENTEIYDVTKTEVATDCVLNPKSFSLILDEDIHEQISCLEKNLFQFARLVRRDDPNYITEDDLTKFVYKFFKNENPENIIGALKLIYQLNSFLFKDRGEALAKVNLTKLFQIITLFNKEGVALKEALKGMNQSNYLSRRTAIYNALKSFSNGMLKETKLTDGQRSEFDLIKFLVLLNNQLTKHPIRIELVSAFLPFKELILGGAPSNFSDIEAIKLFNETPNLVIAILDTMNVAGRLTTENFPALRSELETSLVKLNTTVNSLMSERKSVSSIDLFALLINLDRELTNWSIDPSLLHAIFDFKSLMIGGERNKLTSDNFKLLVNQLPILAISGLELNYNLHGINGSNYKEKQSVIRTSTLTVTKSISEIMGDHRNNTTISVDIMKFMTTMSDKLDINVNLPLMRALLPIKQLALGGDRINLRPLEISTALSEFHNLVPSAIMLNFESKELDREIYHNRRNELFKVTEELARSIQRVLIASKADTSVNIQEFFIDIKAALPNSKINFDLIESAIPLKQFFVGGDYFTITSAEIVRTLSEFHHLVIGALDSSFSIEKLNDGNFDERKAEILSSFKHLTDSMRSYLEKDIPRLSHFPIHNYLELLANTSADLKDSVNLINALIPLKNVLVGGNDGELTAREGLIILQEIPSLVTEALELNYLLRKINEKTYWKERPLLLAQIEQMVQTLKRIHQNSNATRGELDLGRFFIELTRSVPNFDLDIDLVQRMLFIKKVVVAGDRKIITHKEIPVLFKKAQPIVANTFDLIYSRSRNYIDNDDKTLFLLTTLSGISRLVEPQDANDPLFSNEDLNILGNYILQERMKKDIDLNKFQISILNVKEKIIGGKRDENYTVKDLSKIFDLLLSSIEIIYFNSITYEHFKTELAATTRIENLTKPKLPGYNFIDPERIPKHWETFLKIAKDYRFFHEQGGVQYYLSTYKRTKFGFNELATIRHIFSILMAVPEFAHELPNKPGVYGASQKELETILLNFKDLLEAFSLWPKKFATFARNALLLSDLFQFQSNGDGILGLEESTEYMALVLTAVTVGNDFTDRLTNYCHPGPNEKEPSFEVSCYRKYFFPVIMNELGHKKYFAKLASFAENANEAETSQFLADVEVFARDYPDETIRITKREFTLLIGAILNIESTLIRFDNDDSNLVEPKELDKAFLVYKETILRYAPAANVLKYFARSLFFYTLKKKTFPKNLAIILSYHYFGNKNVIAKRQNIGALLSNVVRLANNSAQNEGGEEVSATPKDTMSAIIQKFINNETLLPEENHVVQIPLFN